MTFTPEGIVAKVNQAKRKVNGFTFFIPKATLIGKFFIGYLNKFKFLRNEDNWVVPKDAELLKECAISQGVLQKRFKSIVNLMQWEKNKYTFHSCKRGGATRALEKGLTVSDVAQLGRWKDSTMATRYNRPETPKTRKMASRMLGHSPLPFKP